MIFDIGLDKQINRIGNLNGSSASLGVLMGNTFKRNKGRAWALRKRSMEIWPEWIKQLSTKESPLEIKTPLIALARSQEEGKSMERLCNERKDCGLEIIRRNAKLNLVEKWPRTEFGGLVSHNDGRIDPIQLQQSIRLDMKDLRISEIAENIISIKRGLSKNHFRWILEVKDEKQYYFDTIIICSALNSEILLKQIGYEIQLEPVLGQVIDLEIQTEGFQWSDWPAVLQFNEVNLIPYASNRLLMGATLERGKTASKDALKEMHYLKGNCPIWLQRAIIKNKWYGIRSRPINRSAPILETLENGLIVATGHYRNGILLAPATAEWVANQID